MNARYVDMRLVAIRESSTEDVSAAPSRRQAPLRHLRMIGEPVQKPPPRYKYALGSTEKPCSKCGVIKPLEAFNPFKNGALGKSSKCKACINEIGLAYTKRSRELRASRPRPDRCEVCERAPSKRALSLDHCHMTGKFRGWLCSSCNTALGHVDDSPELLKKLSSYLERHSLSHDDAFQERLSLLVDETHSY